MNYTKQQAQHVAALASANTKHPHNVYTLTNGESYVALPEGAYVSHEYAVWICEYRDGQMVRAR